MVGTISIWVYVIHKEGNQRLHVHFLSVGQGDAAFIESPTGTQMLIDGGSNGALLRELSQVMPFYDRSIDVVVATHPDFDHIGGLIEVMKRYEVGMLLVSFPANDTDVDERLISIAKEKGVFIKAPLRGSDLDLGAGVHATILFPDRELDNIETNTASLVLQLRYGKTAFMFTGDSPDEIEEYLVTLDGKRLESDVLKLGHHGSRTSTSELFLGFVSPDYAVISAGKDNSYGHPHEEVLEKIAAFGIQKKDTLSGMVSFQSDGTTVFATN